MRVQDLLDQHKDNVKVLGLALRGHSRTKKAVLQNEPSAAKQLCVVRLILWE